MVQSIEVSRTPFIQCNCKLAEGPAYDHRTDTLFWLDIEQKRVYWCTFSVEEKASRTDYRYVTVAESVTVLALTTTPGVFVVGAKCGYARLDLRAQMEKAEGTDLAGSAVLEYVAVVHKEKNQKLRFNDGYVDSKGRFFAGTMVDAGNKLEPIGKLYQLSLRGDAATGPEFDVSTVINCVTIPNGLGFSPDNRTLYFTDSPTSTIFQFDYDAATGTLTNRRPFVHVQVPGFDAPEPDGMTVARDGSVWTAIWGTSRLRRYAASGALLQEFHFPTATRITCATFAGARLDRLVVTTASLRLAQDGDAAVAEADEDLGGNLFVIPVEDTAGQARNVVKF